VARGALGNPWIFKEIAQFLKDGTLAQRPGAQEIVDTMRGHLELCIDFYGEKPAVVIFRKFFAWYTRGFRKVRPLRERVSTAKSKFEMLELFEKLSRTEKIRYAYDQQP
jgi:tRNA-dihydrouridine synthase B